MNDILYGGMMDVVIKHWVVPRRIARHDHGPSRHSRARAYHASEFSLHTIPFRARALLKTKLQTPPRINAAHTSDAM
jgi:hypothetical protein